MAGTELGLQRSKKEHSSKTRSFCMCSTNVNNRQLIRMNNCQYPKSKGNVTQNCLSITLRIIGSVQSNGQRKKTLYLEFERRTDKKMMERIDLKTIVASQ